ncbi:hypothetical protein BD779DRAFT_1553888 [Infundibulicybe gibba]|nr:hypothetical protein BD779DRAFT_1553888 [Infundibulicybe gibba]
MPPFTTVEVILEPAKERSDDGDSGSGSGSSPSSGHIDRPIRKDILERFSNMEERMTCLEVDTAQLKADNASLKADVAELRESNRELKRCLASERIDAAFRRMGSGDGAPRDRETVESLLRDLVTKEGIREAVLELADEDEKRDMSAIFRMVFGTDPKLPE